MDFGEILILAMVGGIYAILFVLYRAVRFDPRELTQHLQRMDASASAGTARQKRKADELIGLSMLESFPVVKTIAVKFPELGKYIQTNPGMVPYVASVLSNIVGSVGEKLPPEIQPLIQGLLGVPPGQTQQTQQKTRQSQTGWR